MTTQSVWHTDIAPEKNERTPAMQKEARRTDDLQSLKQALLMIDIHTNRTINTDCAQLHHSFSHNLDTQKLPDIYLLENADTVRFFKEMAMNATHNICIAGQSVTTEVDNILDGIPMPNAISTAEEKASLIKTIKAIKKQYANNGAFPSVEADHDYILSCAVEILNAVIKQCLRCDSIGQTHKHLLEELCVFYYETRDKIDQGVLAENLFTPMLDAKEIDYISHGYKVLEGALITQINAINGVALNAHLSSDFNQESLATLHFQKACTADMLIALQNIEAQGLWPNVFEHSASEIASKIDLFDPETALNTDLIPTFNEMVGIGTFLMQLRAQSVETFENDPESLELSDGFTQQTLNLCAKILAATRPSPTQTIHLKL
ncbi:MAG: hypothetical protein COB76_06880 [Alphaproteobacteria bacterium]|nr:MAG: hypothetical protein COB76_06880 [Alphaproteobacteria bacterium]